MNEKFSLDELSHFTGSEEIFQYWGNKRFVYTQGIQYLANKAKCYWLIDEIGLILLPRLLKKHPDEFYTIQLSVNPDSSAMITVDDGNGNIYLNHRIDWTTFPITDQPVKLFLCDSGTYYCLMLPNEY